MNTPKVIQDVGRRPRGEERSVYKNTRAPKIPERQRTHSLNYEGIEPIRNDEDYSKALDALEQLLPDFFMHADDSPICKHFEILSTLIEAYERDKWPAQFPDPIDALCFYIKQRDLDLKDLEKIIGSSLTTARVLRREEPLTISMIWKICKAWKIPAESLIQPYQTKGAEQLAQKHTVH